MGNGGWAGTISYPQMAKALQEGYATASTDTGHKGGNASFAIGHPEKLIDFGYRAVHEMTVQSKALINALYQKPARLSYWNGCSTGGRQGLMAAQRYPDDFDAILAGAPANNHSRMGISRLAVSVPTVKDPASAVPAAKLAMVTRAVLDACDGRDGVKDGFLNDPRACTFDVAKLQCQGGDAESCLTAAQVTTMKRAYAPLKLANGQVVFAGKEPGSETAWGMVGGTADALSVTAVQIAHNDASWDPKTFDLERDLPLAIEKVGFADQRHRSRPARVQGARRKAPPVSRLERPADIRWQHAQLLRFRARQDGSRTGRLAARLHGAGMGHCQGGAGPDQVNWMAPLERWRESGKAPERIDAARVVANRVEMTRPLCPYPQIAQYTGVGSTNDAANFVCKAP